AAAKAPPAKPAKAAKPDPKAADPKAEAKKPIRGSKEDKAQKKAADIAAAAEIEAEIKRKPKKVKPGSALVIVESPAKAKTINKYLGANYIVKASVGHVRDLPKSKIGVDLEKLTFDPSYEVIDGKK